MDSIDKAQFLTLSNASLAKAYSAKELKSIAKKFGLKTLSGDARKKGVKYRWVRLIKTAMEEAGLNFQVEKSTPVKKMTDSDILAFQIVSRNSLADKYSESDLEGFLRGLDVKLIEDSKEYEIKVLRVIQIKEKLKEIGYPVSGFPPKHKYSV